MLWRFMLFGLKGEMRRVIVHMLLTSVNLKSFHSILMIYSGV